MTWMDMLARLWGTILVRPYVFLFLAAFIIIAVTQIGWRRTLVFGLLASLIGFCSEVLSLHTGFPYGSYEYLSAATRDEELWLFGVPLMSPLSFSFLTYAGTMTALLVFAPLQGPRLRLRFADVGAALRSWKALVLSPISVVLLDVVIDPVALQGERWFLGNLYRYLDRGQYFGVPLSNFAGWLLVSFSIVLCFQMADRWLGRAGDLPQPTGGGRKAGQPLALLGPALYAGVLAFNLCVTFAIGEMGLGLLSSAVSAGALGFVLWRVARRQPVGPADVPNRAGGSSIHG